MKTSVNANLNKRKNNMELKYKVILNNSRRFVLYKKLWFTTNIKIKNENNKMYTVYLKEIN